MFSLFGKFRVSWILNQAGRLDENALFFFFFFFMVDYINVLPILKWFGKPPND